MLVCGPFSLPCVGPYWLVLGFNGREQPADLHGSAYRCTTVQIHQYRITQIGKYIKHEYYKKTEGGKHLTY